MNGKELMRQQQPEAQEYEEFSATIQGSKAKVHTRKGDLVECAATAVFDWMQIIDVNYELKDNLLILEENVFWRNEKIFYKNAKVKINGKEYAVAGKDYYQALRRPVVYGVYHKGKLIYIGAYSQNLTERWRHMLGDFACRNAIKNPMYAVAEHAEDLDFEILWQGQELKDITGQSIVIPEVAQAVAKRAREVLEPEFLETFEPFTSKKGLKLDVMRAKLAAWVPSEDYKTLKRG